MELHALSIQEIEAGGTTEAKEVPVLLPDPMDPLTSSRRDPFGSFVRPLSQLEQYLFDHCKLLHDVIRNIFSNLFADSSISLIDVLYCRCNCCHYPV